MLTHIFHLSRTWPAGNLSRDVSNVEHVVGGILGTQTGDTWHVKEPLCQIRLYKVVRSSANGGLVGNPIQGKNHLNVSKGIYDSIDSKR